MRVEAAISAVDECELDEETGISAIRGGKQQQAAQKKKRRQGGVQGSAAAERDPEISRAARLAAGLCIKHWQFGDKAHSCIHPCTWAGNAPAGGN